MAASKKKDGCWESVKRVRYNGRSYLAEFFATYVFIVSGLGGVAAFVLTGGIFANWLTLALSFGFGLTFAIYLAVSVSGAHLNPGITLMFAIYEDFPWRRVPGYILAQMLGAFASAATVFGIYYGAIMNFSGGVLNVTGPLATSIIFYTSPAPYESYVARIFDQFFMSALFGILIYPILDAANAHPEANLGPFFVGLALTVIALAFGSNTGFAVNPARDFGPRVFAAMVYGRQVFTVDGAFFWIPLVIPFIGLPVGGGLYKLFIVRTKLVESMNNLLAETNLAPEKPVTFEEVEAEHHREHEKKHPAKKEHQQEPKKQESAV